MPTVMSEESSGSLRRSETLSTDSATAAATPLVRWNRSSTLPATRSALPGAVMSTSIWARLGSRPVSWVKSSWTPVNSICRAMAPATATAIPLTMRAAVPLLNCSRRTASCQATPPESSRPTTVSTIQGSSAVTPTSSSRTPPTTRYPLKSPFSLPLPIIGESIARPATGSSSRHHSRRRAGRAVRTTPSGSMTTPRSANSVTRTLPRHREGDQEGEQRGGRQIAREDADAEQVDRAHEFPAEQEEAGAEHQPEHGAGQCLAGRDPARHAAVGADQPQCREPPVPPLAAEPHRRRDEDGDRHQQHHEDDQDEQQQDRGQALVVLRLPDVAVLLDTGHPAVAADVPCDVVGVGVVGEFARTHEARVADRAGRAVRQPLAQQGAVLRRQQLLQPGGDVHLALLRQAAQTGRHRCLGALGLQQPAADFLVVVAGVDVRRDQGVLAARDVLPRAEREVRPGVVAVVPLADDAGQRGGEQQQRHSEPHADGREHGPYPALAAAGDGEAGAQGEVAGPGARAHTARSMSRDFPSRTTISRSE